MPQAVYVPKSNHPWRRYRHRSNSQQKEKKIEKSRVYPFLKELVDNWDDYDLGLRDNFSSGRLKYMTDSNVALWLADHLNRNFVCKYYEEDEDYD